MEHYRDDNTEGYTPEQLAALNAELNTLLDGLDDEDARQETIKRHADEVARR